MLAETPRASVIGRRILLSWIALFVVLSFSTVAFAQMATISGTVYSSDAQPVPDAEVTLVELRRSVKTGADGTYRFNNVPPGHYHVRAESRRFGIALGEADVAAGQNRTVEIVVDPAMHAEEIVVTAGPDSRRESEVYQPIEVLNRDEIAEGLQPTLGETLNQEPGVNSTYFGPGSSRPIIRGLGSDRIRVLEEGVGTGDASNISPDHAVSVDPAKAEQIEILRGPATLLYGSNAVGGVVNIVDHRVPNRVPTQAVTGTVDLRIGSVASEKTGSISLLGGANRFAWHADFTARDTSDYEIPGPADEHDDEPDELTGVLENSSQEAQSGTLGASFVTDRGYIGAAWSGFKTNYGVPGHAHEEEEIRFRPAVLQEEHEGVRIDLDQRRIDIKGELSDLGFLRNTRLRIGINDYEHKELEGTEIGTLFTNESVEGRLEATHRPFRGLTGSFGVQLTRNDFSAVGEEAFIPANETRALAVFGFEEFTAGKWDLQFGARYEDSDLSVASADLPDRAFTGTSGSFGTIYRPATGYAVAISLARAVRLPTATELYANGPHAATRQFEVGNPMLDDETALGIDLSLRKSEGRFRGTLNFFQNYFEGYIYETPTGEEEDDLPVFVFTQADARFRGIELDTHTELWHFGEQHLELEGGADLVRASLEDGGDLPRIPPARVSLGLRWEANTWSASAEARRYLDQNRVAAGEEPTAGYTLVNAAITYRFLTGNMVNDVMLRGTNLTDELARVHTSPIKELAPLPGRDVQVSYRLTF